MDVRSDGAGGFHLFAVVLSSGPLCRVSAGSKHLSLAEFITQQNEQTDGQVKRKSRRGEESQGLILGTSFLIVSV